MHIGKKRKDRNNICSIQGCKRESYTKGLCHKHFNKLKTSGTFEYLYDKIPCSVSGCNNLGTLKSGLCNFHLIRRSHGTPLEPAKGSLTIKGERNPRWNGGVFEYKDHYLMKKLRKEVLEEAKYICERCKGKADRIHHRDNNKAHQTKENYMPSCAKCNSFLGSNYAKSYGVLRKEYLIAVRMNYDFNIKTKFDTKFPKELKTGYIKIGSLYKRIYGVTLRQLIGAIKMNNLFNLKHGIKPNILKEYSQLTFIPIHYDLYKKYVLRQEA